jgi:hypothetical protein
MQSTSRAEEPESAGRLGALTGLLAGFVRYEAAWRFGKRPQCVKVPPSARLKNSALFVELGSGVAGGLLKKNWLIRGFHPPLLLKLDDGLDMGA